MLINGSVPTIFAFKQNFTAITSYFFATAKAEVKVSGSRMYFRDIWIVHLLKVTAPMYWFNNDNNHLFTLCVY